MGVLGVGHRTGRGWQRHVARSAPSVRGTPGPYERAVVQLGTAPTDGQFDPTGLLERLDEMLAAERVGERRQPVARGGGLFVTLGGGELVHPGHQRGHHE